MTFLAGSKSAYSLSFHFVVATLCFAMAGCSAAMPSSQPTSMPQLRGSVFGGQQPVRGATVQLYAAGTAGYGMAPVALLPTPAISDANGNFSLVGNYTCPSSSSQLYILATGGDPGLGSDNPALALMAALGPCTFNGTNYTLDPSSYTNVDEVTTVASVYALAPFMNADGSSVGASSGNATGIANAFAAVSNMVDTTKGTARANTVAGHGMVPEAEINTLADIIAACINSNGATSACSMLFAATTPSGGSAPANTVQAMLNIARNPSSNISTLFGLAAANAPFQPVLSAAPNDWAIVLNYTGGGISNPNTVAIDAQGNPWISNTETSVTELSSTGEILSGDFGYMGGGINNPRGIAIDSSGNAWVANLSGNSVTKMSSSGTILSGAGGFTGGVSNGPIFVGIDGSDNAWVPNYNVYSVAKLSNGGTLLSGANGYAPCASAPCPLGSPVSLAIDGGGNAWVVSVNPSVVVKLSSTGTILSGANGFTDGLSDPTAIAFDGSGVAWVTNTTGTGPTNSVTRLSSSGALLSNTTGGDISNPVGVAIDGGGHAWVISQDMGVVTQLDSGGAVLSGEDGYIDKTPVPPLSGCTPLPMHPCTLTRISRAIAIDGSGNAWVTNADGSVSEFVGIAAPVVTPLSKAVKNNMLGERP